MYRYEAGCARVAWRRADRAGDSKRVGRGWGGSQRGELILAPGFVK